jgi:heme-degrading monooxygenase HmoA
MWAQIVKTRMKPGVEQDIAAIREEMKARVSQREGLVRALWMQNQNDPQEYYTVIVFETEEQARAGERELEQDPLFQRTRSLGEGTPEYVDLDVIESFP